MCSASFPPVLLSAARPLAALMRCCLAPANAQLRQPPAWLAAQLTMLLARARSAQSARVPAALRQCPAAGMHCSLLRTLRRHVAHGLHGHRAAWRWAHARASCCLFRAALRLLAARLQAQPHAVERAPARLRAAGAVRWLTSWRLGTRRHALVAVRSEGPTGDLRLDPSFACAESASRGLHVLLLEAAARLLRTFAPQRAPHRRAQRCQHHAVAAEAGAERTCVESRCAGWRWR